MNKIIDIVNKDFPNDSLELSVALDLLNDSLERIYDSVSKKSDELKANKKVDECIEYCSYLKEIIDFKAQVSHADSLLKKDVKSTTKQDKCEFPLLNTDGTIRDFERSSATAFSMDGTIYSVTHFTDMLIKLCSIFYKQDKAKFLDVITHADFQRRKVPVFSKEAVEDRNFRVSNSNIYVWTNLSTNVKCEVMADLIRHFGVKEFSIDLVKDGNGQPKLRKKKKNYTRVKTKQS